MTGRRISHFEIVSELGAGGMGRVFLAQDLQLDRKVALKFLSEELVDDDEAQARFLREARSASALDHDHIGVIYEAGEVDDQLYIAMAYYEGETLRDRLARGPVPLDEAISILRQMAAGLAAAHEAGIVHRDIKPANVMLTEGAPSGGGPSDRGTPKGGMVKILDFGLAKPVRPGEGADSGLTITGATLGTVAYMSPEQARGLEVDERTDLWSLGVIAYELLTGRHPFASPETDGVSAPASGAPRRATFDPVTGLVRILTEPPDPLDRPDLPDSLVNLVEGLLEKRVGDRIATAASVETLMWGLEAKGEKPTALRAAMPSSSSAAGSSADPEAADSGLDRRSAVGSRAFPWKGIAAAALVLGGVALVFELKPEPAAAFVEGETLVLTDFVNQTGDPVFDGTLEQGLEVKLEESPYLDVLAPERVQETLAFMELPADTPITRELGREICQRREARATVTGEIAALGSNYVLTFHAVDCLTGKSLATRQLEAASKEDVLGALGQATTDLRRQLGESLASLATYDTPLEQATTSSLEALQAYSRGMQGYHTYGPEGARSFAERAIELDPDFALGHVFLGGIYRDLGMEAQAQEHFGRAYALIERVSELERFEILTSYQTGVLGDWHAAIETNEQWARAYPRNHFPHMWLTSILGALGQYEKAVSHGLEALRLNPTSGNSHLHLTQAYFGLGRLDKVREQLAHIEENGIDIRGPDSDARFRAYLGMAVGDEARVLEWLSLVEGTSREGIALSDYTWYLARKGRLAEARTTSRRATKVGERFGNLKYTVLTMVRVAFAVGDFGYQEEARARFLQAVEMTGGYPNLWFALGLALHGERERAEAMSSEVLAARPHSTLVQDIYAPFFEGLLALADEDVETAIRSMERTRPYDGSVDGLPIARFRADAYLANGQAGQAVKDLGKLISFEYVEPAHHYHDLAYLWLARAHVANDDPDAARESYEEFFERMKDADEGIPEIERAREEYAALLETGA